MSQMLSMVVLMNNLHNCVHVLFDIFGRNLLLALRNYRPDFFESLLPSFEVANDFLVHFHLMFDIFADCLFDILVEFHLGDFLVAVLVHHIQHAFNYFFRGGLMLGIVAVGVIIITVAVIAIWIVVVTI